ncbi:MULTISPECIES: hypothetical protein [Vibrio]|uniref:hypothetical protein n=1 Tax=Vibrio TaxID=662 RepID=UPI001E315F04|nr:MULTISPECIES: hypothetical protein [Vibrio]MCS0072386.1 hypothetical protein [Vibrio alginolyticus]MDW1917584.1 hypothetical protein [Vibrio sp. Vb0349]
MQKKSVRLEGLCSMHTFGKVQQLTSCVKVIDLFNLFSLFDIPNELEEAFQSIHSRKNQKRIELAKASIESGLDNVVEVPPPSLTFVVAEVLSHKTLGRGIVELEYDPLDTMIVDGVITLFAMMQISGFSHPFEKKRISKDLTQKNSRVRQELASYPVQVNLLFSPTEPLSQKACITLYKKYSQAENNIYAPLIESLNAELPLNTYVKEIADDIALESFGGMKTSSVRLSVKDPYVTTEATMIRLVLGAIGGADYQDKNKVDLFGSGPFSAEHIDTIKPYICIFMEAWLNSVKAQLLSHKNGFHYSTTLWQSLGLVIHKLFLEKKTLEEFAKAGAVLGRLDYSKTAKHWGRCDALELDVSGQNYKNVTGGGRAFRIALTNYLLEYLSEREK